MVDAPFAEFEVEVNMAEDDRLDDGVEDESLLDDVKKVDKVVEGATERIAELEDCILVDTVLEVMMEDDDKAEDGAVVGDLLDAVALEIDVVNEIVLDGEREEDNTVEVSVDGCTEDDTVERTEEDMLVDRTPDEAIVLDETMPEVEIADEAVDARLLDAEMELMMDDESDIEDGTVEDGTVEDGTVEDGTTDDGILEDNTEVVAILLLVEVMLEVETADEALEAELCIAVAELTTDDETGNEDDIVEDTEGDPEAEAVLLVKIVPEVGIVDEAVEATLLGLIAELRTEDAVADEDDTELKEANDDAPLDDDETDESVEEVIFADDGVEVADPDKIVEEAETAPIDETVVIVDAAEDVVSRLVLA